MTTFRKSAIATATLVTLVGGFEGLRQNAYRDPIGIPTICYGETKGVKLGQTATKAECDTMLMESLAEHEAGMNRCLRTEIPIKTRIAFVSFTYNVGVGNFCKSTLARKANAGDLIGACNELPRWNKAGGITFPGLTRRREAERKICLEAM